MRKNRHVFTLIFQTLVFFFVFFIVNGIHTHATENGSIEQEAGITGEKKVVLKQKTLDRFYDPVELRGEMLTELLGSELSSLRLYSFLGDSFRQVPFQFDEWTPDGYMVLDIGPEANAEKGNGILDPQDMLVFMARGAGDKISKAFWPEGVQQGIEIEIIDPLSGGTGWLYLLQFSDQIPQISFPDKNRIDYTDEVRVTCKTYGVQGANRTWKGNVYKLALHRHFWTTKEAGGDGKDFIDRLKFRFRARMLFGAIKINFDEDSIVGAWSKIKSGPVRTVGRQWIALTLPFGLKSPKFYGDFYCYDTLGFTGFQTDMPFNPGYVVTDFRMTFGHDLHEPNAYGMQWYNSNNPEGFLIDGVTSPMEAQYDDSADDWRCVTGANGWAVYRSLWDEFYRSQAEIKVIYSDDKERHQPPEYYPGDLGYVYSQSTVRSLKPRKYNFQVDVFVPYQFYDPKGVRMDVIEELINIRRYPLQVRVASRQATNTSYSVSMIEP